MSGVCFPPKIASALIKKDGDDNISNNSGRKVNGLIEKGEKLEHLMEYEDMVASAENKCTLLKEQLEKMKQIYNKQNKKMENPSQTSTNSCKPLLIQVQPKSVEVKDVCNVAKSSNASIYNSEGKCLNLVRQNSHAIGTDTTGAALGTINSILTGITESIKIPEVPPIIAPMKTKRKSKPGESTNQVAHGVADIKIKSKRAPSSEPRGQQPANLKSKSKVVNLKKSGSSKAPSKASLHTIKTIRKNKRSLLKFAERANNQPVVAPTIPVVDKRSRKAIKRLRPPTMRNFNYVRNVKTVKRMSAQDLVEIYHNQAVKESNSSDSNETKNKTKTDINATENRVVENAISIVPPLEIEEIPRGCDMRMLSAFSRNYEMPTVSSRMKQVAKYYMNSFNLKTIPFCPATSTGPSHNIGINIQQVMNMVKNKNPSQKLSPTLAYNIGLAAGRWSNKPLSVLVTNMTSRILSQCPLSKSVMNYQQLQEAAKTIPHDIIEEADENSEDIKSPETQTVYITGPSGDIKVNNRKQTVWSSCDVAGSDDKKCTCTPQKGVEFRQIISKYGGKGSGTFTAQNSQVLPIMNKFSKPAMVHKVTKVLPSKTASETTPVISTTTSATVSNNPLDGKERKLKEVMSKLHDEFEQMNKKYEDLSKKAQEKGASASPRTQGELEQLDRELNSKEEEILMVMTLYKEVLALKQQVKDLKERTSKEIVSVKSQVSKLNGCHTATTAGLLNKLLKQVQHFQTHYQKSI